MKGCRVFLFRGCQVAGACFAIFVWLSAAVVAQEAWRTMAGDKVTGTPVGAVRHHISGEKIYVFKAGKKETARVPSKDFSSKTIQQIEAAIGDYNEVRANERAAKAEEDRKRMEAEAKRAEEDMARAILEQQEKEEAWRSQKFVDAKGRSWSREEITAHNDAIWLEVDRAKMKHADRGLGEAEPLGKSLGRGDGVLGALQQFAEVGFPCTREGSGFTYESIGQFMEHVGRANGKDVELLFEYTDAEHFMLMFPDGKLRTTEEMWNEALLGRWPAVHAPHIARPMPGDR